MLDSASVTYLTTCKQSQLIWDEVAIRLRSTGWSETQLEEARQWYTFAQTNQTPSEPVTNKPQSQEQSLQSQVTTVNIGMDGVSAAPSSKIHKKSKVPIFLGIIVGLILVLVSSINALAYLISTGKIALSNTELTLLADKIVMVNPILPKTPKVILMKSVMAHQKVLKSSVNFSLAASSDDFQSLVGGSSIDIELSGYSDVSDTANPQFSLNGSITKDFNFDIRKKDKMLYFKINKIPSLIYTFVGLEAGKIEPVISHWVGYDTATLNTDAQKRLQDLRTAETPETEATQAILLKMLETDILPHITLGRDTMDGRKSYKLEFTPTPEILDKLEVNLQNQIPKLNTSSVLGANTQQYLNVTEKKPLSTYLKDVVLTWWIDESEYYVRKVMVSMKLETGQASPTGESISSLPPSINMPTKPVIMVMALRLTDFNKVMPIEVPDKALTIDEFVKQIMETVQSNQSQGSAASPLGGSSYAQARDAKRKVDLEVIATAILLYQADNGGALPTIASKPFPTSATCIGAGLACFDLGIAGEENKLVPSYLTSIPRDPLDGTADDVGYTIHVDQQGKLNLSAWGEVTPKINLVK
jgi:hypothetical protein